MYVLLLLLAVGADPKPVFFDHDETITHIGASRNVLAALDDKGNLASWAIKARRKLAEKTVIANDVTVAGNFVATINNSETTIWTAKLYLQQYRDRLQSMSERMENLPA